MLSLVTLPEPATLMTAIGTWSSPLFNDLLPIAEFVVGFAIGGLIVLLLIKGVTSAVNKIVH